MDIAAVHELVLWTSVHLVVNMFKANEDLFNTPTNNTENFILYVSAKEVSAHKVVLILNRLFRTIQHWNCDRFESVGSNQWFYRLLTASDSTKANVVVCLRMFRNLKW